MLIKELFEHFLHKIRHWSPDSPFCIKHMALILTEVMCDILDGTTPDVALITLEDHCDAHQRIV